MPPPTVSQNRKTAPELSNLSEEELLSLRLCDLPLKIEGTWLADSINQLHSELQQKGIAFRPECYLADEWLTPLNEPVVGIPFYLAHPVLIRLERKMMLEAEGEDPKECLRLLRHECGHALCYAYGLHRKKQWRKIFGDPNKEYPDTYRYQPYSRNYVRHLDNYYAQYHPEEDFVETFAVWLTPGTDWQAQYKGWGALAKLKFVDEVMGQVKGNPAPARKGTRFWAASRIKMTLRTFYKKKRELWAEEFPDFHDVNLKKMFLPLESSKDNGRPMEITRLSAPSQTIEKYQTQLLDNIALATGERKYIISDLLEKIARRCRELNLVSPDSDPTVVLRIASYVTTLIMNYRYTGWFRGRRRPEGKS